MLNLNIYISESNIKRQTLANPLQKGLASVIASPQYKYNLQADTVCFSGKPQGQTALEEKTVLEKLNNTDRLINQSGVFLEEINKKFDYHLKIKEKNRLIETKKLLTEKELELKKLSESIKQEEERKKLEAVANNLNRVNEILAARKILNNQKVIARQEVITKQEQSKQEETKKITEKTPEPVEKTVIQRIKKTDVLMTKINDFLTSISEKPDCKLKIKEKTRLKEAEKLLAEKNAYLQALSEKINKENEKQKFELVMAKLAKTDEILVARIELNAKPQPKKVIIYTDTPERTKKKPVQKSKSPVREEIDRLNQIRGTKNLARQRDILAKKVCGINEKLNILSDFLTRIENKPDKTLKSQQKSQLNQIKPVVDKLERQVTELEEKSRKIKDNEQKELQTQKTKEKIIQINKALQARANIKLSNCTQHPFKGLTASVDLTYKNTLNLKSTPNFSDEIFQKELDKKIPGIIDEKKAAKRVSSLSIYLKEKMIGFEVPEYGLKEEKRGGYQWFERGLENLLIGSKKANLQPEEYKDTAKELFGILSVHDNYWKSPEFSDYLSLLKTSKTITENQKKAVDATVLAIQELNEPKQVSFGAQEIISMRERAFTPMKFMPEIYEKCAYTGNHLDRDLDDEELTPSADHIIPHSWENSTNDDGNFIICSIESNTDRGNISLIKYLKGNNGI